MQPREERQREKARAKKPSSREFSANKAPLAAHLQKFAEAVADDHSHVEGAILAGRAPGSASFLYRQPGVKDRIAELLAIKKKASEEMVAKNALRPRCVVDIDESEIIMHLTDIVRSKTEPSRDRIRASIELSKILKSKGPKDLKAHGWSANEIDELFAAGRIPPRLLHLLDAENEEATWIAAATSDVFTWMTEHTKTRNEHWKEEGRPKPYEHLPRYDYLHDLLDGIELERITWFEKSRDLMISWACVGYFTMNAMVEPSRGVIFQTQKEDKVIQLIDYSKWLYRNQDPRLQAAFRLRKPLDQQPADRLDFANGSYIVGIPAGSNQIRSYHPWGYLNDESSFQADAGECYNEALAAVKGKIVFNSSAGPGWYSDARRDITTN